MFLQQQLGHPPRPHLAGSVPPAACRRLQCIARASSTAPPEPSQQQQQSTPSQQQQPPAVALNDSRTQAFVSWAYGPASIRFSGIKPSTFAGVRGLAATTDIANDALIVEVPRRSAIVLAPKQRNACPGMVTDEWWKGAPWFAKMAAVIIWHKRQGAASPLASWIAQLPASTGVPVLWEERQLAELQYPPLIEQVRQQRAEWRALHADLASRGTPPGAAAPAPSESEFLWAMSIVRSRTFSGPYIGSTIQDRLRLAGLVAALVAGNTALGLADPAKSLSAAVAVFLFNLLYELILSRSLKQYAICPMIDLFNHSSAVQSEVSYNYFGDSYSVVASRDFRKGEQVFISYGSQSNDSLMQYYGFSEADNPADTYVLADLLGHVEAGALGRPVGRSRLEALRSSSGLAAGLKQVVVQRGGFPGETLQALRFLLAGEREAAPGVSAFAKAGSPEQEAELAAALAAVVRAELASLGTSLQEDQALLAAATPSVAAGAPSGGKKSGGGGGLTGTQAAAVAFRIEKKRVLEAVLANLGVQ